MAVSLTSLDISLSSVSAQNMLSCGSFKQKRASEGLGSGQC